MTNNYSFIFALAIILTKNLLFIFACQPTPQPSPFIPPYQRAAVRPQLLVSNVQRRDKLSASEKGLDDKQQDKQDGDELVKHQFDNETNEIHELIAAPTSTTILTPTPNPCNTAYVLAVTTQPYNEQTVQAEHEAMMSKLNILETFLQVKLSSFGEYTLQPMNEDGFYAIRILYTNATGDCEQMRDFVAKTVSYSKEVERALFNCKCGDTWVISKIH